jgi:hypothetical protein
LKWAQDGAGLKWARDGAGLKRARDSDAAYAISGRRMGRGSAQLPGALARPGARWTSRRAGAFLPQAPPPWSSRSPPGTPEAMAAAVLRHSSAL